MNLNDRELLARTLQAEAGNQGLGGMIAAGSVIMNRVGGGYGSNVRDVILAPGQFSAWNSLTGYAGGEQGQNMDFTPSAEAYKAADTLLSGQYEDITGGATHYYNPAISQPSWGQGGNWKRIGDHVFGKADAGRQKGTQAMDRQQPSAQQMQQMQQQPQQGGLMGFLRNPRTREALLSMDQSGMFEGLRQRATADVQVQQEQAALAAEEAKAQKQRSAAMQQQQQVTNRTMQVLAQRAEAGDALAGQVLAAVQSGAMNPADAMKLYLEKSSKDDRTSQIKNYEYWIAQGKTPAEAEGLAKTNQSINIGGQRSPLEEAEGAFLTKRYEALGKQFAEIEKKSGQAGENNQTILALKKLYEVAPSGPVSGRILELFPEANDVAAAVQSLRTQLAPQLRVEGSGSTSDIEYAGMLNSLGSLKNSPAANSALLDLMLVKNDILQQKAAVASRVGLPAEQGGLSIPEAQTALLDIDAKMWESNQMVASIKDLISSAGGFVAESNGNTITTQGGLSVSFD